MWTAKRIGILTAGLLASMVGFGIYTVFLGTIDGVPPLPEPYLPAPSGPRGPEEPIVLETDRRLEVAFGKGCKELTRPLRLWLSDKSIVFAAGDFIIGKDGRVRLAPFSAAVYHKAKNAGAHPEISTIRADMAILTLDRPVASSSELNNRKIIGVEMTGQRIEITNNRGSAEKSDDIDVLIINKPLFYEERRNQIFTDGVVCLTDHQSKPPMVIRGHGLEMTLAKDTGPNRKPVKNQAAKSDAGNIERLHLKAHVDMRFYVDAQSGFLGGTPNTKKPPPSAAALAGGKGASPEKAQLHIRTPGPFVYDLIKEVAWFESPPLLDVKNTKGDAALPEQVAVARIQTLNGGEVIDQLTCNRLDLQFRRKLTPGGGDKEIETAHATCRDGGEVVLALVSEGMDAYGNEMLYRAADAVNGPMTTLKGDANRALRTVKDGHKMRCQELHLHAANRFGEGQKAWARGPGQLDLLDAKNPDKVSFPTHVIWRDTLEVVKEKEGGEVFDRSTVTGEASFIDDAQKQELHGDKIVVWTRRLNESAKKPDAVGGGRQELHRVLAIDRVRAVSPEFNVRKSNRLTMIFLPTVARNDQLPDLPSAEVKTPSGAAPAPGPAKVEVKTPTPAKKSEPPIDLEGNDITVVVSTLGTKKDLHELVAKGNVHVFQPDDKPGTKRLDLTGTLLTVRGAARGRTMIVYGDKEKKAQVEFNDTIILGPLVTLNQADNHAEVDGQGAMDMPSNKGADGSDTKKKNTRIRIDWKKGMTFDGRNATFRGGVQVREHGAHSQALCEEMTVILDKHVSFKEGEKDQQSAKIDRLIFDKNVFIEDYKFDDKKQPLQYNKLQARELLNLDDGPTRIKGPGWVRLLAKGSEQSMAPQGPGVAAKPGPAKTEWKLTHVKFATNMISVPRPTGKKTSFYGDNSGGVEVFHFPTLNIDDKMDPDHPKKDELYLRCGSLEIEGKQTGDRTLQTMIARHNCYFRTDAYLGYADIIKFDEENDRVIFEGVNGNNVRIYEMINNQPRPKSVTTTKVLYNRKTGEMITDGISSITN